MKRILCLILIFCLLLSGCSLIGEHVKEPVTFYYVSENYQKDMDQVIVSEIREASGHRDDLTYLLALYSLGPSSEGLKSPLPRNTTILPIERTVDEIVLALTENGRTLKDADFTLASACIALTCMDLIDVQQVTVVCEEQSITLGKESLLLNTDSASTAQEETQ